MPRPKKINPALATPQAPRALRVGSKGHARAVAAAHASEAAPEEQDDDAEEADPEDEKSNQEAHDAIATSAAAGYRAAADAAEATMGSDSASMLQAGEGAHDAAMESGAAFKSSCIAMRGATEEAAPDSERPGAPAAPTAQAIARASATPTAAAHLEVAQYAALGRDVLARTGAKNVDAAMLTIEAALSALGEQAKFKLTQRKAAATADVTARRAVLEDAVAQDVIKGRAKAFHIDADGKLGVPLAAWSRGTVAELTETLVTLGYKPGGPPAAHSTLIVASADGGDEAGLAARAAAAGVDIETRRAAEQNLARSAAKENAR